jgi:cell wall-associated NlpC family hydrolase
VRTATARTAAGTRVRPVLTAREAQALREALARRQAQAGTATATRTAGTRAPARRTVPATRRAATRRTPARPTRERRPGLGWSRRFSVVAAGTLALPLAVSLLLPAPPSPDTGPPDPTSLALTAQSTLLQHVSRYRHLQQELEHRRAELEAARTAEQQARAAAEAEQRAIGASAADLYRGTPQSRVPMLALDVHDPSVTSDVLFLQTVADRADRGLSGRVVRAERSGAAAESAARQVAAAQTAVDLVQRSADRILAASRAEAEQLGADVSGRLAALGALPVDGAQQSRNEQALHRWQTYLARLAEAGIDLPRAADLADPAGFPAGLTPALDAAGAPIPGVAWAVLGNRPVTVLPAETVAAVSSALSQLGKPFRPGGAGPDTYDCGGFTSASWLMAGYAVPTTPQAQWAGSTAVPLAALQVGDLVFSPGGLDVGIYVGDGDVVGASAATFRVGVRSVMAGSSAVRVPLGAPAQPNAQLTQAVQQGPCGAPLPPPGKATPAWGGYANGSIPVSALCPLGVASHVLRCDAAASYGELSAEYAATFGSPLCITDSYRTLGQQVAAFISKPALAAVPGTSNHGWALAVDLCGGINSFGTPQWKWMAANAGRFGFVQPDWAGPRGEKPEPWHWEYGYIS